MNFLTRSIQPADPNPLDFSPPLLRLQESPPNPLGRKILWTILILLACLFFWALLGKLDIVAVADGKLIPQSYLKIVQPSEAGIVKDILVKEGETVAAGQVLMRMDRLITEADAKSLDAEFARKRLSLRRIDAELSASPFRTEADDPPHLYQEVEAQHQANRNALAAALAEERSRLIKARQDLSAAEQVRSKLTETLPHYREQEKAFDKLAANGFAGSLAVSDKRRERIEKEQELKAQHHIIESARAGIVQSEKKLLQIESDYRRQLYVERNEVQGAWDKLAQEVAKQSHRNELLELKATQDSIVKDLATHTIGTVAQPGTVLITLVPQQETLRAEVWVNNEDIGFVRLGQRVKLKFAAFPFQKYGMVEGSVEHLSADAADSSAINGGSVGPSGQPGKDEPLVYKAFVALDSGQLQADGATFFLSAGMRASAEILLGRRSVFAYLLSPVQKAWHEAGRER